MDQQGAAAPPRPAKPGRAVAVRESGGGRLVSLAQPRPESERRLNAYVEAPPRARPAPPPAKSQPPAHRPLTAQPLKLAPPALHEARGAAAASIVCAGCGRCRCQECARPRGLPSRWLGGCLCSAETAIDYSSCMCCAKALFYHCCGDGDGDATACADEPCSCAGPRAAARWGCLAALAVALPCLLCYWPLRGAAALCAEAYARTSASGCRCRERASDKLPLAPAPTPGAY